MISSAFFRRLPDSGDDIVLGDSFYDSEQTGERAASPKPQADDQQSLLSEIDSQSSSSAPLHEQVKGHERKGRSVELVFPAPTNQGDDAVEMQILMDALGDRGRRSWPDDDESSSTCSSLGNSIRAHESPFREKHTTQGEDQGYLKSIKTLKTMKTYESQSLKPDGVMSGDSESTTSGQQAFQVFHDMLNSHDDDDSILSAHSALSVMSPAAVGPSRRMRDRQETFDAVPDMIFNGDDSWRTTNEQPATEALGILCVPAVVTPDSSSPMHSTDLDDANAFDKLRGLLFDDDSRRSCSGNAGDLEAEHEEDTMGDESWATTQEQPGELLLSQPQHLKEVEDATTVTHSVESQAAQVTPPQSAGSGRTLQTLETQGGTPRGDSADGENSGAISDDIRATMPEQQQQPCALLQSQSQQRTHEQEPAPETYAVESQLEIAIESLPLDQEGQASTQHAEGATLFMESQYWDTQSGEVFEPVDQKEGVAAHPEDRQREEENNDVMGDERLVTATDQPRDYNESTQQHASEEEEATPAMRTVEKPAALMESQYWDTQTVDAFDSHEDISADSEEVQHEEAAIEGDISIATVPSLSTPPSTDSTDSRIGKTFQMLQELLFRPRSDHEQQAETYSGEQQVDVANSSDVLKESSKSADHEQAKPATEDEHAPAPALTPSRSTDSGTGITFKAIHTILFNPQGDQSAMQIEEGFHADTDDESWKTTSFEQQGAAEQPLPLPVLGQQAGERDSETDDESCIARDAEESDELSFSDSSQSVDSFIGDIYEALDDTMQHHKDVEFEEQEQVRPCLEGGSVTVSTTTDEYQSAASRADSSPINDIPASTTTETNKLHALSDPPLIRRTISLGSGQLQFSNSDNEEESLQGIQVVVQRQPSQDDDQGLHLLQSETSPCRVEVEVDSNSCSSLKESTHPALVAETNDNEIEAFNSLQARIDRYNESTRPALVAETNDNEIEAFNSLQALIDRYNESTHPALLAETHDHEIEAFNSLQALIDSYNDAHQEEDDTKLRQAETPAAFASSTLEQEEESSVPIPSNDEYYGEASSVLQPARDHTKEVSTASTSHQLEAIGDSSTRTNPSRSDTVGSALNTTVAAELSTEKEYEPAMGREEDCLKETSSPRIIAHVSVEHGTPKQPEWSTVRDEFVALKALILSYDQYHPFDEASVTEEEKSRLQASDGPQEGSVADGVASAKDSEYEEERKVLEAMILEYEAQQAQVGGSSAGSAEDSALEETAREDNRPQSPLPKAADVVTLEKSEEADDAAEKTVGKCQAPNKKEDPVALARKEKNQRLVRELKHIQAHGPNMFESMEEKIESWRHHEANWRSEIKQKRLSLRKPASTKPNEHEHFENNSAAPVNGEETELIWGTHPSRLKPTNLIRELQFVHTQGEDIVDSLENKVKSWQRQESVRQLQEVLSKETEDISSSSNSEEDNARDSQSDGFKDQKDKDKPRQSTVTNSGNTASTRSMTDFGSSTFASLLTSSEHAVNGSRPLTARRALTIDAQLPALDCRDTYMIASPISNSCSGLSDWDAASAVMIVDDEAFRGPAVVTPEHRDHNDDNDNETVEVTVHSFLTSLGTENDEWTVMVSVHDDEEVLESFDLDELDEEDEGEEYGVVGHGVSDNISVISELTMPTVASLKVKKPAAPPALSAAVTPAGKTPPGKDKLKQFRRKLQKVAHPPRTAKENLPFQRVKLKKSFTNPPRLPQMRDAALLRLYKQQLKPVGLAGAEGGIPQAPWRRTVRRCFSDKPSKRDRDEAAEVDKYSDEGQGKTVRGTPAVMSSRSKCILDFDWDELDDMTEDEARSGRGPENSTPVDEALSQIGDQFRVAKPEPTPEQPSRPTPIGQTDGFYESVSVSFLASSVRDPVIVQVMEEALRILRPGGILNVLDIDGSAVKRIQEHPQFGCLSFGQATARDQEHLETNTKAILEKSGLRERLGASDPHLVHWTAIKQQNMITKTAAKAREEQLTFKQVPATIRANDIKPIPAAE